jgi:hypothetical protein
VKGESNERLRTRSVVGRLAILTGLGESGPWYKASYEVGWALKMKSTGPSPIKD